MQIRFNNLVSSEPKPYLFRVSEFLANTLFKESTENKQRIKHPEGSYYKR